jgi:hypothetical protein
MDRWLQQYAISGSDQLDMPYMYYLAMLRRFIEPVPVDEAWYRQTYPGVAQAVDRGVFRSVVQHFLVHGYFEGRRPYAPERTPPLVPFAEIRAATPVRPTRDGLRVRLPREMLMGIVRRLLEAVPVDEAWYRQTYPGVAAAISAGNFASAARHFVLYGYQEGRWPFPIPVEEDWYFTRYPDVPHAIAAGHAKSAQDHFWRFGYREGRIPTKDPVSDPTIDRTVAA